MVSRNVERANENDGFKMTALENYIKEVSIVIGSLFHIVGMATEKALYMFLRVCREDFVLMIKDWLSGTYMVQEYH